MYKRLLVTVLVSVFVFSLWGKTETVCQSLEVEDSVPVFQKDTLCLLYTSDAADD